MGFDEWQDQQNNRYPGEGPEGLILAWITAAAIFVVIAIWLSLWAINKPHSPEACAGMTPFDCVALVQEAAP